MKLKVCGMKYSENIKEVSSLQPDFMGFIFWKPSKRFFEGPLPKVPSGTQKIGVFVDAPLESIIENVKTYDLQAVQLHGEESPGFCRQLNEALVATEDEMQIPIKIIKVFSVMQSFNFEELKPYEEVCDYFLFDTKGKLPGGNGYAFDWKILADYPSEKPFFLSGGIGIEEIDNIRSFLNSTASKYCHVIDVNSRFETKPGVKDIDKLKYFIKEVL